MRITVKIRHCCQKAKQNKSSKCLNKAILEKAKNNTPIRVLYKKEGQPAEVKIIENVFTLKKAIIENDLSIIPYEKLFIVCNNQKYARTMIPNIALPFYSIYGDFILVGIDKKTREFKGISQEDVIWYSGDLNSKSYIDYKNENINIEDIYKSYGKGLDRDYSDIPLAFERNLINVLKNIERTLASIVKNRKD